MGAKTFKKITTMDIQSIAVYMNWVFVIVRLHQIQLANVKVCFVSLGNNLNGFRILRMNCEK